MVAATCHGDAEEVGGTAGTRPARGRDRLVGFVGRDRELSDGIAVIDDAAAGEGGLLLISGEPGIGKGMRALARLMSTPGRPHPALDLERIGETSGDSTVYAVAASDAGEMLDEQARRAYRARIVELRTAIDDAQSAGAADRAGSLREELDFITRELSRGLGIGGRARRAGSAAERARVNVTRAVRAAMQRITEIDPNLAAHLNATVRTGTVCVYAPDPRSAIEWTVAEERV